MAMDGGPSGHISYELFADKFPKTTENFCALSTGEKAFGCKASCFLFGDDFTRHNGTGGKSISGEKFDETFILSHTSPGTLSMASAGSNTNDYQVFICTAKTEQLDGKHAVFGKVREDMNILGVIEYLQPKNGKTSKSIAVADCGQI
ncbi:hypothetical protein EI555_002758 [Monodon monoceros]|uniref:Peptidyl-prolyl cis-trans isomerase n=1 Tax=Monodon monoceros TaxID=40151 RepID=A0A4U1EGY1_MONMO|nr:hypothetical protein EI555_002758 [Monodon monoceros]